MVAREKLNEGGKEFSLKEYVNSWRNVKNSLTSVLQ